MVMQQPAKLSTSNRCPGSSPGLSAEEPFEIKGLFNCRIEGQVKLVLPFGKIAYYNRDYG